MKKIKLFEEFNSVEPIQESFYRLPKDVIGNELYVVNQSIQSLYSGAAAGNDVSPKEIDLIIKNLQQIKSSVKKFNKAEEIEGTVYESAIVEGAAKQFDADFNDMVKNVKSGFGWIDPDYVQETWENTSDIDFVCTKRTAIFQCIECNAAVHRSGIDKRVVHFLCQCFCPNSSCHTTDYRIFRVDSVGEEKG